MATNIKELSKREELFTGGHRLCAGCGAGIMARQVMLAASKHPVVVTNATGCLEVASTIFPYTAWKNNWFHSAFENASATASGIEAAYDSLKRQGKIKEDIRFIAFGGDGGTYDIGFQSLSGAMERGHRMLAICYNNEAYMNCLSLDCLIATKEGLKKITDVKLGEDVYAFDMRTHQLVLKRCSRIFDNGVKEVYELSTLHHSIKATANHPFLVLRRNGRGRTNELVWKKLEDIMPDDEIVVSKQLISGKSAKFDFKKTRKGDYKVNRINEVKIPETSSSELMKYLGLYVGDGWTRTEKGEVGFALPEYSEGRKNLLELHEGLFGNSLSSNDMYVDVKSVNVARFIDSLGFGDGARNKSIPAWVFTLPIREKESFVEGLMLSDGYRTGNSMRYVSASSQLLETLRLLLQTMDYRVGKIHSQTKPAGTVCVKRRLLKESKYGYICFSKKTDWNVEQYPSQYKYQNFLINNEYFIMEKVKKIKLVGKEPTLDLRVEDEHNFIADGIVVHNTGIQRSSATPRGAHTTTSPSGSVIPGKVQYRKDLTACMIAHNIKYVAQTAICNWRDLTRKVETALDVDGPTFLNIYTPCRLGWGYKPEDTLDIAQLAVDTCYWPLYEVIDGKYKINYKPKEKKPLKTFLEMQNRFRHLKKDEYEGLLQDLQANVDRQWQYLLWLAGEK